MAGRLEVDPREPAGDEFLSDEEFARRIAREWELLERRQPVTKYSVDQLRDRLGRWTDGGPSLDDDVVELMEGERGTPSHQFGQDKDFIIRSPQGLIPIPISRGPGPIINHSEREEFVRDSVVQERYFHGGSRPGGAQIGETSWGGSLDALGRGYYVTRDRGSADLYGGNMSKEVALNLDKVLYSASPEYEAIQQTEEYAALKQQGFETVYAIQMVAQAQGFQAWANLHGTSIAVFDADRVAVIRSSSPLAKRIWGWLRKHGTHDQETHGNWARGGGVMTRAEAEAWSEGSSITGPVYHFSFSHKDEVMREGLRSSEQGMFGNGIYMTLSQGSWGGERIEARVRVDRVFEVPAYEDFNAADLAAKAELTPHSEKNEKGWWTDEEVRQGLIEKGYDAVRVIQELAPSERGPDGKWIEGSGGWVPSDRDWLIVLDPAHVRVVNDDVVTKHQTHDQSDHGNWARGGASTEALTEHLTDYKPERSLEEGAIQISDIVPGAETVLYARVPGLAQLHSAMGVRPTLESDPTEYANARTAFFATQLTEMVPVDDIVFTQETVNEEKVFGREPIPWEEWDPPVDFIRSGSRFYLMNGHHRAIPNIVRRGATELPGRVFTAVEKHADHNQLDHGNRFGEDERETPTSVSVVDTRTWEEGDDDKWHPVPGSGDPRPCDRCGKQHEIHVTVEYPSKSLCVGTTCATDPEAPFVRRAVAQEKTRIKLTRQREKLAAQLAEFDIAKAQVDLMALPEIEGPFESEIGDQYRRGDAHVYAREGLTEERLWVLEDQWRANRLAELTPIRYRHFVTGDIESIDRRLENIERKQRVEKMDSSPADVHVDAPMGSAGPPKQKKRKRPKPRSNIRVVYKGVARRGRLPFGNRERETDLSRVFRRSFGSLGKPSDAVVTRAIERGDPAVYENALDWVRFTTDITDAIEGVLGQAMVDEGRRRIDDRPLNKAGARVKLRFDIRDPRVIRYIRARAGALVTAVSQDVRESIRAVIGRMYTEGIHPTDAIPLVRASLGEHALFPRWAQAVLNLAFRLTDQGMDPERIQAVTGAYYERLADARANMIARTEIIGAQNAGRTAAWDEMTRAGTLDAATVQKQWDASHEGVCPQCQALDGTQTALDGVFVGGFAAPPAHPNCRCVVLLVRV